LQQKGIIKKKNKEEGGGGGGGVLRKNPFHEGGVDIFYNYSFVLCCCPLDKARCTHKD